MNMSDISAIAYKSLHTSLTERGKCFKYHCTEFGRNSVCMYGSSFALRTYDVISGVFSICRYGNAAPQPLLARIQYCTSKTWGFVSVTDIQSEDLPKMLEIGSSYRGLWILIPTI